MKRSILATIVLLIAMPIMAAQNSVFDITQGSALRFTAGNSFITGSGACNFNWTSNGLKSSVQSLFEGATSYEWDTTQGASSLNCINLKTDIIGSKVDVPLVDPAIFQNRISATNVAFANDTIVRIAKGGQEPTATYVTAGTIGTPNYFFCEVPTYNPQGTGKSLQLKWLLMTGADNKLAPGWILSMSWNGAERRCANMTMSFDPALLQGSAPPPAPPMSCPIGCIAAP